MGKILVSGSLNNFDIKIKKFLDSFSKESFDKPKIWEGKIWKFFSDESFVFYLGTIQKTEKNLDLMGEAVVDHYMSFLKSNIMHLDFNFLFKKFIDIHQFIKHGGDISEYYRFFFMVNFCIRQMYTKRTDSEDSNYKNFSTCITIQNWILGKEENKLYQRVWIIKPDNTITYPDKKYWEHVDDIISKEAQKIVNQDKNTNIKKRDPIESRLRHEVFKRDGYKCLECGKTKENTTLHVDHITPVSQGGTDELDNLQTLCQACNLAKCNRKWEAGDINGKER